MGRRTGSAAFGKGSDHVLVTLHALTPDAMKSYSDRLSALFAEGDAFQEIWRTDGMAWIEMKDGKPGFTSKLPFRLHRRHQHDHDSRRSGTIIRRITSSPANRGYSSCGKKLRIISCPSLKNSVSMAASLSSR